VWPTYDWKGGYIPSHRNGKDLAGGFFATVWQVQADMAWHPSWLGLPGHNSLYPCVHCRLHKTELFDVKTLKKQELNTHDDFQKILDNRTFKIELWKLVGGCHVTPDLMHTKWLGVDQYLLGSALAILHEKFGSLNEMHEALLAHLGLTMFLILIVVQMFNSQERGALNSHKSTLYCSYR